MEFCGFLPYSLQLLNTALLFLCKIILYKLSNLNYSVITPLGSDIEKE